MSASKNAGTHRQKSHSSLRSSCRIMCVHILIRNGKVYFLSRSNEIELPYNFKASQVVLVIKNLLERCWFHLWVGKIPWRRAWQPTPVFLPGEPLGQRSLAGYSPRGLKESDMIEWLSTHNFKRLKQLYEQFRRHLSSETSVFSRNQIIPHIMCQINTLRALWNFGETYCKDNELPMWHSGKKSNC